MSTLELRIPPLALVIIVAGMMWISSWAMPGLSYPMPLRQLLAGIFAGMGVLSVLMGVMAFRRSRTTVNPLAPESSTALVVSGVYRLTRNPMYLGFLFLLIAWSLWLSHLLAWLWLPGFVWYMNRYQILPEERALMNLFGNDYTNYCQRVSRWL